MFNKMVGKTFYFVVLIIMYINIKDKFIALKKK